tara:strand:+ start:4778 stop:6451 length:1674 start_codon:yes stop_codon:yes gene_type:complete
MINWIDVRDFVVIKHVQISFEPGFTVITGETGAGKSVLVDALAILLGGRASADLVRSGAEHTEVQADFDISNLAAAKQWLAHMELDGEADECTLRRTVYPEKASRGFINGRPVPIQSLRELGALLTDIHGQHEHHLLLRRDVQRMVLDSSAGIAEDVQVLAGAAAEVVQLAAELSQAQSGMDARREHQALLRHQVEELTALAPDPDEFQQIGEKHARLSHTRELAQGAWQLLQVLDQAEDVSASVVLTRAANRLGELASYDTRLGALADQVQSISTQLADTVAELQRFCDDYALDPDELERIDQRLRALHDAGRKYRITPDALKPLLEDLEHDLARLDATAHEPKVLEQRLQEARQDYDRRAGAISEARSTAAETLAEAVNAQLPSLGLETAVFRVTLRQESAGLRSPHGLENVYFELQSAPDLAFAPLERAASGGELSRVSLAVQLTATAEGRTPSCIYDEVDVGIGGKVAEIVGQKLKSLAQARQVLCITHLPQVAAQGHHHLRVTRLSGDETQVELEALDAAGRSEELARMLGGVEITAKTRAHAEELLSRALI